MAGLASLNPAYGILGHACLQTSCCELQLSVHDALIVGVEACAPPAGLGVTKGPTARQEFWQLMAVMSQVFEHAVEVAPPICGVGNSGVGVVCTCATLTCAAELHATSKSASFRTDLIGSTPVSARGPCNTP
jgi:hypothetical protein